jgi:septum formation protein
VVATDVEELERGPGVQVAAENARRKAELVADRYPRAVVLGVDTVVELDGTIHGKPADPERARETLETLSGRTHEVLSGVCVIDSGDAVGATARTRVRFRSLDERLIEWYVASGEWRERAGGYAIQGRGAALVAGIDGDYLNVVGLPLGTLLGLIPGLLTDFQV